jgi:hypothetical protein
VSTTKKRRGNDDPPYTKYAFLNPYNLSLLAGAGVASAATGQWWVGVGALVCETVWMLFAPDSTALQKAWFDDLWEADKARAVTKVRDAKYRSLAEADQARAQIFFDTVRRIRELAKENPSLTAELVQGELVKLDELYDDFLDLGLIACRGETHLRMVNFGHLNTLWHQYEQQAKGYRPGDKRREIAEKNLEVLKERKKRFEDLSQSIAGARGQMDLLDNTVRLLGDEIVAMTAPSELAARLDELRIGVSAIRESARDVEQVYADLEEDMQAEEPRRAAR